MISKEPQSLEKFPVPVSGQEIPRGWFARLVAFMNSLVLRGDNQFFCVNRSNAGTTISPTKKLIDLLSARGGSAPASGGTATGIEATVSGGTASVSVSGNSPLVIAPANANVQISGGTNGELLLGASAMSGVPDYASPVDTLALSYGSSATKTYNQTVWLIGSIGVNTASSMSGSVSITIGTTTIELFDLTIGSTALAGLAVPLSLLIPANSTFTLSVSGAAVASVNVFPSN